MPTATELQTWRDRLLRAKASPALRVEYDGKVIQYRDVAEIDAALRDVEGRLASATSGRGRTRRIIASGGKGIA